MKTSDFIKHIAANCNCDEKSAQTIIEVFTENLLSAISEGYDVQINKLGSFKISKNTERKFYNIKTGKLSKIPAHNRAIFKPDTQLKMAVR